MKTAKKLEKTIAKFGKDPLETALKNKDFREVLTGIIVDDYCLKEKWGDTGVWECFCDELVDDPNYVPYSFIGKRAWKKAAKALIEDEDDSLAEELYDKYHEDIVKEDIGDNFFLDYEWPETEDEDDVRKALTGFCELYKGGLPSNEWGYHSSVDETVDDLMTWVEQYLPEEVA